MANTSVATLVETYLDQINDKLSALAVLAINNYRTIAVDNLVISGATAPTNAVVTSTSVDVTGMSKITVYTDVTGATTGVVITVRGGVSGFGMFTLRSATASAGLAAFVLGNLTTGASPESNGISRIDNIAIQLELAANTGAGTGVTTTLRTRFLTEP